MSIWRTIIVYALAASLLMVGVCPCPAPSLASAELLKMPANGTTILALSAALPARCCFAGVGEGNACGMPCCRRANDPQTVPPAAPDRQGNESRQHLAAVCCGANALLSPCDATALARAFRVAGSESLPVLTLQTQSVRIQT